MRTVTDADRRAVAKPPTSARRVANARSKTRTIAIDTAVQLYRPRYPGS